MTLVEIGVDGPVDVPVDDPEDGTVWEWHAA